MKLSKNMNIQKVAYFAPWIFGIANILDTFTTIISVEFCRYPEIVHGTTWLIQKTGWLAYLIKIVAGSLIAYIIFICLKKIKSEEPIQKVFRYLIIAFSYIGSLILGYYVVGNIIMILRCLNG